MHGLWRLTTALRLPRALGSPAHVPTSTPRTTGPGEVG